MKDLKDLLMLTDDMVKWISEYIQDLIFVVLRVFIDGHVHIQYKYTSLGSEGRWMSNNNYTYRAHDFHDLFSAGRVAQWICFCQAHISLKSGYKSGARGHRKLTSSTLKHRIVMYSFFETVWIPRDFIWFFFSLCTIFNSFYFVMGFFSGFFCPEICSIFRIWNVN